MAKRSISDKPTGEQQSLHSRAEVLRLQELILNASDLAFLTTTSDGVIASFNNAAEVLLGYDASDVVGKTTPIIFHDPNEVLARAEEASRASGKQIEPAFDVIIAKAVHEKTWDRKEWTFIRKDGSRFPASLTVIALRDEEENVIAFAGLISDRTEHSRLKEEIVTSEQKFRLLAENIPGAIYLCRNDEVFSVIYINDHIETISGYSKEDFLSGKITFAGIFHPEDAEMIRQTIDKSVGERQSFQIRYRIRHASGEWRWVIESGIGVYDGDNLIMLEGFLQDITLQKEAEEKLQKIAEENLKFFNNPVNLNAVADYRGHLERISPSWTKMLGWTDHELRSQPVVNFVHPDDRENTQRQLESLTLTSRVQTLENRLTCKDGTYRWLLWALAADPQTKKFYASAIDISARKKSEENILDSKLNLEGITLQLQEQNRRLDEFAHIISHNLRAPLNNIQALINLLDDQSEIADYKLIFDKLKNVAKNLSETMNELMDTLKAKAQPQVDLAEIRFKEVLDKVVQSLEGELITAQASVTFDFNDAASIRYSKPYLESIFQNLLTNAIKYRSPERKPLVHFQSSQIDKRVTLRVTDNGRGIDMQKFGDKVFGLHKTFHDHQEARGVGLFLVKTQIEALGGSISVTSEVDKGTTFTILFN